NLPVRYRDMLRSHYRALRSYEPDPYRGPFALITARAQPLLRWHEPLLGWGKVVQGAITHRVVPGAHDSILAAPYVQRLAEEVARVLDADDGIEARPQGRNFRPAEVLARQTPAQRRDAHLEPGIAGPPRCQQAPPAIAWSRSVSE